MWLHVNGVYSTIVGPQQLRMELVSDHSADSPNGRLYLHTTQTHMGCMLHWSLSGRQHVCICDIQEDIKGATEENLEKDVCNLIKYLSYKPHSSFKHTTFFLKIFLCHSIDIFDITKYIDVSIGSQWQN